MSIQEIPQGTVQNQIVSEQSPLLSEGEHFFSLNRFTRLRLPVRNIPGIDDMKGFVSRHPRFRGAAEAAAIVLVSAATTILALAALDNHLPDVLAEGQKTAVMVQLNNEAVTNENGIIGNPASFIYQGEQNQWRAENLRGGFGFNNPDRVVGTFDKYIQGLYQVSDQLYEGYYPEIVQGTGIRIGILGIIVKPEANKAIILTATTDNDPRIYHPAGAEMWDLRDTHNLAKRIYVPRTGLPVYTLGGSYASLTEGTDAQGYFTEVSVIRSPNPAENRKQRHYFDASYMPVGDWVVSAPQHKLYVPLAFR